MINPYHSTVARVTLNLMCYSVRITSQKAYSGGLFVMDANAMP